MTYPFLACPKIVTTTGLDSVEESSQSIISTMAAFGIESSDTMSIIDKFNEVGNNFAITSAGIGDALQRSASALFASGNTLDESVALITAANQVVQNPEVVGTALKTLSLRIRGVKTELEEAGLETEGMAETTAQLQDKLKALTHGKVDIMLNADEFKNTTQILREMSDAWDVMTNKEQAAALELIGGKRQANILASVITNFETVEEVIETSMESQGSAIAENQKWLDSIEGKTYQFTNALQTMWSNLIDSEMIKSFIDFGTEAIQFLDTGAGKAIALLSALKLLAKFKGFSIAGVAQGFLSSIQQLTSAHQMLSTLPLNATTQQYAAAVSNLTVQQQANLLASRNLTQERIKEILLINQATEAEIKEALAQGRASFAKKGHLTSAQALNAQRNIAIATSLRVQAADASEENKKKLLAAANQVLRRSTEELTEAQIRELLVTQQINNETAESIAKTAALAGAQAGSAAGKAGGAIGALFASNPVGVILTVISLLSVIIPLIKNMIPTTEDYAKKWSQVKSELKDMNDELEATQDRIDELEKMDSLSITDQEELKQLKLQNAELEKRIALKKIEEEESAKETRASLEKDYKKDYKNKEYEIAATSADNWKLSNVSAITSILQKYKNGIELEDYEKDILKQGAPEITPYIDTKAFVDLEHDAQEAVNNIQNNFEQEFSNLDYTIIHGSFATGLDGFISIASQKIKDLREYLYDEEGKIRENISDEEAAVAIDEIKHLESELAAEANDLYDLKDKYGDAGENNAFIQGINAQIDAIAQIVDPIGYVGEKFEETMEKFPDAKKKLYEMTKETEITPEMLGTGEFSDLIEILKEYGISVDQLAEHLNSLSNTDIDSALTPQFSLSEYQEEIEGINDALDNMQSAYSTLSDVVKEYNNAGYLTMDTLQALLELDPQYLAMLQMENGLLTINKEKAIEMVNAKLAEAKATALDTAIKRLNTLANTTAADSLRDNTSASINASEALGIYAGYVSNAGSEAAIAAGKIAALNAAIANADANTYVDDSKWQQVLDDYNNTVAMIDSVGANIGTSFNTIMKEKDSSSSSNSDKDFDFVDVYFTNLENKISERTAQLETLLDDTSQLDLKKELSDEIIDYYRQQAASAQKAADYYSEEAAKTLSKIPEKYRDAIKNGTLDVATISDDSLNDLLTKYRDYVDKAADYTEKYWSTLEEVANKAKEKFTDIQSDYENKISFNDLFVNQIQNEIDKAEEAGEIVSEAYYEALIKNNETELKLLKEEQAKLLEVLQSGDVKEGSDQYYEMVSALDDVDSAIDKCEQETISWRNAIDEINAANFDKFTSKVNELNTEIQNMYKLFENNNNLVDDAGNWTKDGVTALALLVQQMENAKYAADEVGKEIASLKPEDFESTELYEKRLNELKETQWDYIQESEDAKKSIVDLNKTRIDAVRDGMEKELEATKELIKAKKELLNADKDQYEFEKTMSEHSKNIAEIERKLVALNNDHSMEAEAKKRRLQAELAEAQAAKEESLRDKNYDDINKAYDDEEEAAEESHKKMLEKLEEYLKGVDEIVDESIFTVLANAGVILQNLTETADQHGVNLSNELKGPWEEAEKEAENYKTIATTQLGGLVGEDGTITIFSKDAKDYLTSPFVNGGTAAETFKTTVADQLGEVKKEIEDTYNQAIKDNQGIIDECNKAIEAYKDVREEASKPVESISTSSGNLDSGSSGNGSGGGGGGGGSSVGDPAVKNLQTFLNNYFDAKLVVDGKYGPATTAAVKAMQKKLNMNQNGKYQAADVRALKYYFESEIEKIKKNYSGSSTNGQAVQRLTKGKNSIPAAVYAKGTMGASKDHWAITDEPWLGDELVLIPGPKGNLQYMRKGTSVIPADITEKLMNLALDPTSMLESNKPVISAPHVINNNVEINMSIAEVVHIDEVTSDTIPDLTKAIDKQMEKYMAKVNGSLKKYVR